eukprot:14976046-Alexandrium_andersonii.AAC.1
MGTVSSESDGILDPCAGGGGGTWVPTGVAGGGNGADTKGIGIDGMDAWADVDAWAGVDLSLIHI